MDLKLIRTGIPEFHMVRGGREEFHISAIIRKLCLKLGHYEDSGIDEDALNRFGLGSAFEDAVAASLTARYAHLDPERYIKPGELELDGLIGNPDLFDTIDWAIEEMKLTWMSSRHDPESTKFWKYWVQVKAYAYMMGSTTGRLHVAFVNGDYKRSTKGPSVDYRVWEAKFTKQELWENWRMLKTNAA